MDEKEVKKFVKKRYGQIAKTQSTCCSPSCCATSTKDIATTIGYSEEDLKNVPEVSNMGLGCGNPVALASLKEGETVLDLGSGGGIDVFLAARRVGAKGKAIGVDMTEEMVRKARATASKYGYENVEFRLGEIENLPIEDNSVDAVISNCVINLSSDKEKVFQEAYRVLKPSGRIMISDLVTEGELPEEIRKSFEAWAGCLAGALEKNQYLDTIKRAGFKDPKIVSETSYNTDFSKELKKILEEMDFTVHFDEAKTGTENLKIKHSNDSLKGIPKNTYWIRFKPSASVPIDWIKRFSRKAGLKHRTQKDGHAIIYGEERRLKELVNNIIGLIKGAQARILSVQVEAYKN
jgi:ubiquinone/menaquinone biosynthesis C-methylase UbiE